MSDLGVIHTWGAKAALTSALEEVEEDDTVIVIFKSKKSNVVHYRTANVTNAEAVFLLEERKLDVFRGR